VIHRLLDGGAATGWPTVFRPVAVTVPSTAGSPLPRAEPRRRALALALRRAASDGCSGGRCLHDLAR